MPRKRVDSIDELEKVYYIYGDEELLVEEALKRLKGLFASQVDEDFNLEVLDAPEAGAEKIIDSAETIPLLATRRLVVARGVNLLSRKEQEALAGYLERSNPATTLVLVAHIPGPGVAKDSGTMRKVEGSALFKKAKEHGEVLKFSLAGRGRQQKLDDWLNEQFALRGRSAEAGARELMFEKVGSELRDLADVVERVCLFAPEKKVISVEDVAEVVVVPVAEQGIFELVDAVADRRRDLSLYLLNRLIRQGESPHRIFSLLLRQFRLISRAKVLAGNHDYSAIASELGVPPFLVGKCVQQSKRYSAERLRSAFSELMRARVEMHSASYLPEGEYQAHVLEFLIVKIVG